MAGIFLSYRRDDAQGEALHLFDDLKERFGPDQVFMDVAGIDPGIDFRKAIDQAVGSCNVLLVMIGRKWLDSTDARGNRRLDDPQDFVKMEAAAALRREIPVIPVLVQGAQMPTPERLPAELEALAWRNAIELRHTRWDVDVAELVKALAKIVKTAGPAAVAASPADTPQRRPGLGKPGMAMMAAAAALAVGLAYVGWQGFGNQADQPIPAPTPNPAPGPSPAPAPAPSPGPTDELARDDADGAERGRWLTPPHYQRRFEQRTRDGFFPEKVEGRCENGGEQFRAAWKPLPLGADFVSHHGITKDFYDTRSQRYLAQGYTLSSLDIFKDCAGTDRYQATWLRR